MEREMWPDGFVDDAEAALRATLRVLASTVDGQVALTPARECPHCWIWGLYRSWSDRYGSLVRPMIDARKTALWRVDYVSEVVGMVDEDVGEPLCPNPGLLNNEMFAELRVEARSALDTFGWTPGPSDPSYLRGRPENVARREAEAERVRRSRIARRPAVRPTREFDDLPDLDPRTLSSAEFEARLERIPWFAALGRPRDPDPRVDRIGTWEEWKGPYSLGVLVLEAEMTEWRQRLGWWLGTESADPAVAEVEREAARAIAIRVTFDIDGDSRHAPTAAFGQAVRVASTIGGCLRLGAPFPPEAFRQWAWYARGHWPCSYSDDDIEAALPVSGAKLTRSRLIVF